MEIKAELEKPYTEEQRVDFIIEQNHNLCYEIKETETSLQAWGYTEEEIATKERERINNLSLTAADVERAIFNAKGMDFDDIIELVSGEGIVGLNVKKFKIELKANNFYRKHPYINMVGQLLGYTSDDMDYLFENKELPTKDSEE